MHANAASAGDTETFLLFLQSNHKYQFKDVFGQELVSSAQQHAFYPAEGLPWVYINVVPTGDDRLNANFTFHDMSGFHFTLYPGWAWELGSVVPYNTNAVKRNAVSNRIWPSDSTGSSCTTSLSSSQKR